MRKPQYEEAPIPKDEKERLASLYRLNILDTPPEARFDAITRLALSLFKVPISTITLVDSEREWFKSCQGLTNLEGKRAISFCGHAMLAESFFIVPDAKKDPRFAKNPMVKGKPYIRFYAAIPLRAADGKKIGAFCIKDYRPRKFDHKKREMLKYLASWAEIEINAHELSLALLARDKMEADLAEANDTLRLFNKILRHDLLNQLTLIKFKLDSIGAEDMTNQSVTLIKQIAQLEAGVSKGSTLKPFQVASFIEGIKDHFPDIQFNIKGEGEVLADEAFESVIDNIVRNAKVHGKTKKIAVKIAKKNSSVQISIADFGKGIPQKIKNKLFTEGFKYGRSGNSGLGLYIAKKNITRYGGEISVLDNKPKGTVFTISLPKA